VLEDPVVRRQPQQALMPAIQQLLLAEMVAMAVMPLTVLV
jgi:hypothetical protein